ncbi:hypothetical protein [Acidovorax delafieldii]|uniref:hypothetical protein n=1 Tax=Acidovorax delafieldii TaxID=47920 RepID=UPI0037566D77
MIDFLAPAALSAVGGLAANLLATYIKFLLAKRHNRHESLKFKVQGKTTIEVPEATDADTLRQRVDALIRISPRLAVLDGWSLLSAAILERASSSLGKKFDASQNIVQIARELPGLSPELLARIERVRSCRNLIAHSVKDIDADVLARAAEDVVPALREIGAFRTAESDA